MLTGAHTFLGVQAKGSGIKYVFGSGPSVERVATKFMQSAEYTTAVTMDEARTRQSSPGSSTAEELLTHVQHQQRDIQSLLQGQDEAEPS